MHAFLEALIPDAHGQSSLLLCKHFEAWALLWETGPINMTLATV